MATRGPRRKEFADSTPETVSAGMVWERAKSLLTQIDTRLEFPTDPKREEEWALLRVLAKRLRAALERVRKTCRDRDFIDWDYDFSDVDMALLSASERREVRAQNPEYFAKVDKLVADIGDVAMVAARAEWLVMDLTGNLITRYYKMRHPESEKERNKEPVPMLDRDGNPIKVMRTVHNSWDRLAESNKRFLDDRRMAKLQAIKDAEEAAKVDPDVHGNSADDYADNDAEAKGDKHVGHVQ